MKKLIYIILFICLLFGVTTAWAANTHSLDLEKDSSQYATAADSASLSITGDITIEAWLKFETLPSGEWSIVSKYMTTGDKRSYIWDIDAGKIYFQYDADGVSGNSTIIYTDNALTDADVGVWEHWAVAVDVSVPTAVFYKNGETVASTVTASASTAIYDSTAEFGIGNWVGDSRTYYFDGLIDEVRVWNDIRTQAEIQDNYQKELVGNEAGLVAYYKLNNGALDETANDNDLTLVNSPVYSPDNPFGSIPQPSIY